MCFVLNLNLSILSAGGQHLRVSAEAHAQHGVVHHHEVVLRLVLEILQAGTDTRSVDREEDWRPSGDASLWRYLSDLAGGEVPDLDEAVDRPGHQVLTVGREAGTLHVRFLSKLHGRKKRRQTKSSERETEAEAEGLTQSHNVHDWSVREHQQFWHHLNDSTIEVSNFCIQFNQLITKMYVHLVTC